MLRELELRNFKNFKRETLSLRPFSAIVGANASGKSNIRDALRFLHAVGLDYSLAEIVGGKYGAGGQVEWAPLRGAASEVARFGKRSFTVGVKLDMEDSKTEAHYRIQVSAIGEEDGLRVSNEELIVGSETIFASRPSDEDPVRRQDDEAHLLLRLAKTGAQKKFGLRIAARPDRPAHAQIGAQKRVAGAHKSAVRHVLDALSAMRFLDLSPSGMRQPAFPGQNVLGDNGENLPTVLQEICTSPDRNAVLADWLRELTPMDVAGSEVLSMLGKETFENTSVVCRLPKERSSATSRSCQTPANSATVSSWGDCTSAGGWKTLCSLL